MSEANQIVIFDIDSQFYGVSIKEVSEIIRIQEINNLPNMPPTLEGVTYIRESLCSIFNIRNVLGFPNKEHDEHSKIIVVDDGKLGFVVDNVSEIITVKDEDIKSVENIDTLKEVAYLNYFIESKGQIITVLHMDKIIGHL